MLRKSRYFGWPCFINRKQLEKLLLVIFEDIRVDSSDFENEAIEYDIEKKEKNLFILQKVVPKLSLESRSHCTEILKEMLNDESKFYVWGILYQTKLTHKQILNKFDIDIPDKYFAKFTGV